MKEYRYICVYVHREKESSSSSWVVLCTFGEAEEATKLFGFGEGHVLLWTLMVFLSFIRHEVKYQNALCSVDLSQATVKLENIFAHPPSREVTITPLLHE